MLGVSFSICIRSDPSHFRYLSHQTPKLTFLKPLYLHQSTALLPRCLRLSAEGAASAIELASPKKSNAITTLLYRYGFTHHQVQWILHKQDKLLAASPEKTIRPKLAYLLDFGYSKPQLMTLVSSDPHLLAVSLEKRLIDNLNLLQQLLGSEELVEQAIARSSQLLRYNLEKYYLPNVETLRMHGVPDRRIVQAMVSFPRVMTHKPDLISSTAMELEKLGMDPSSRDFIVGINAKIAMTPSAWEGKVALYESFGWSEEDLLLAFTKHPYCMLNSEGKIEKMMEFYVKKLGWDPAFLSERPVLIDLSLERRVLPRCAVLNVLASRGLLGGEVALPTLLMSAERTFEKNYVAKYSKEISVVREAYEGMFDGDFTALRSWEERIGRKENQKKH